jgi:hypothetical protein
VAAAGYVAAEGAVAANIPAAVVTVVAAVGRLWRTVAVVASVAAVDQEINAE